MERKEHGAKNVEIIKVILSSCHPLVPSLLRQIIVKARSKYINVADKLCEFNDSFMLYMTTRLPNPHLSPENQAKVRNNLVFRLRILRRLAVAVVLWYSP